MLPGPYRDRCRGIRIVSSGIVGDGISDVELGLLLGIRFGVSSTAGMNTKPGPQRGPHFRIPGVSRYRQKIRARTQVAEAIMTLIVERRSAAHFDRVATIMSASLKTHDLPLAYGLALLVRNVAVDGCAGLRPKNNIQGFQMRAHGHRGGVFFVLLKALAGEAVPLRFQ